MRMHSCGALDRRGSRDRCHDLRRLPPEASGGDNGLPFLAERERHEGGPRRKLARRYSGTTDVYLQRSRQGLRAGPRSAVVGNLTHHGRRMRGDCILLPVEQRGVRAVHGWPKVSRAPSLSQALFQVSRCCNSVVLIPETGDMVPSDFSWHDVVIEESEENK